jgi:tetratricopeptide (TPR) repeat protein
VAQSSANSNAALFELGKLYAERCDTGTAIEKFKAAADGYFLERNFEQYLACQNRLLRLYAERGESDQIRVAKEKLQDLVLKEGFELNAKTYYTLGICASYKGQYDVALDYFQKSLAIALAEDNKPDICYAINGLGITYSNLDRLQDSLKEIYNLQVFFQVLPLREVQLSAQMLNAQILRKMKKFDQALDVLWHCYDLVREEKNMYFYLSLLYAMGLTYKDAGDMDLARLYLQLAKKSIDSESLVSLSKQVDSALADLGLTEEANEFDLVFDAATNSVTERKKGKVDFKNQFILLDLLRVFMRQPGQVHSKEALVKTVWKQDYDPDVHDNKIYVTIKRLRKLIEPDYDKPKYIFRAKNGYYLNKNARVHLEQ